MCKQKLSFKLNYGLIISKFILLIKNPITILPEY